MKHASISTSPASARARCSAGWYALCWLLTGALGITTSGALASDLPSALEQAYTVARADTSGANADYIPELANADSDGFGIAVVTVDGEVFKIGDADVAFAIMSAAKPFTLSLLLQQRGTDFVARRIGVEPTGRPFNALKGIEQGTGELNPMVNAGAIATVSYVSAGTPRARWAAILKHFGRLAGEDLSVMETVLSSVSTTNFRNRALANLLQSEGRLGADAASTLEVYNKQSCLGVTAVQLARMGATLASRGVDTRTGEPVLDPEIVDEVLAVMLTSGFYDESGWWAYTVGIPAKSGVGGGIVAIAPGRLAVATFSPRLNSAGNSVRGILAIRHLADQLKLSLFE